MHKTYLFQLPFVYYRLYPTIGNLLTASTYPPSVHLHLYSQQPHKHRQWSHRGFTALASKAVAAGHQVVSIFRNVTVGLDVLLGWKSVGHLPCTAVPHPAHMHRNITVEIHSYERAHTVQYTYTLTSKMHSDILVQSSKCCFGLLSF